MVGQSESPAESAVPPLGHVIGLPRFLAGLLARTSNGQYALVQFDFDHLTFDTRYVGMDDEGVLRFLDVELRRELSDSDGRSPGRTERVETQEVSGDRDGMGSTSYPRSELHVLLPSAEQPRHAFHHVNPSRTAHRVQICRDRWRASVGSRPMDDRLYFRQLLAGRDFAPHHPAAGQMQNFAYLIGDRETGECLVVDPAWDVNGLLEVARTDAMRVTGALVTHYHPDHCGGSMFGLTVEGLPELLALNPCKSHVHRKEAEGVIKVTGLSPSDLVEHDSGDRVDVGAISVELLHTPGHTPGSLCFRLKSALVAGDTLFLQGCGRVDLPGGDPDEMYETLTTRLSSLSDDVVLYPGHAYGGEHAAMGTVRRTNAYLQIPDLETWRRHMG